VVYFKNGKKLTCDIVWRKENMVFVVVHGKDFALGYNKNLIDFGKSSPLNFLKKSGSKGTSFLNDTLRLKR